MATQWNYDFSPGEVLTAAVMDSLGAVWETWTPTITASSGTFTSVTVSKAKYARINKIILGQIQIDITNVGSASGLTEFSLPVTATAGNDASLGSGREYKLAGFSFSIFQFSTTTARLQGYAAGATANTTYGLAGNFMYEAA
jgi:hypothetical protein